MQLLLVLVIGFTGGILGTLTSFQFTKGNSTNPSQEIKSTKVNRAYKNTTSTSEAVDKVKNAVVSVITYAETSEKGFINGETDSDPEVASEGSGVIYKKDGKEAYIVTNNHVVDNATVIKVQLSDGRKFDAKMVGKDPRSDIALIQIQNPKNLTAIKMADSDALRVGDYTVAIGNPFGLGETVTSRDCLCAGT